ncbi:hypothetical protein X777_07079 [Ooceraea biroi]|uniref:Uncharacterized protein n=1 Tax=Ooceraea biroi TaxID=2015173 RepID=A0A026W9R5_OOCBI|nr:hypothetical protein X777_07079 [Ooceraea biroi]
MHSSANRQVANNGRSRASQDTETNINARMALLVLFAISLYILCILSLIKLVLYFKNYFHLYVSKE